VNRTIITKFGLGELEDDGCVSDRKTESVIPLVVQSIDVTYRYVVAEIEWRDEMRRDNRGAGVREDTIVEVNVATTSRLRPNTAEVPMRTGRCRISTWLIGECTGCSRDGRAERRRGVLRFFCRKPVKKARASCPFHKNLLFRGGSGPAELQPIRRPSRLCASFANFAMQRFFAKERRTSRLQCHVAVRVPTRRFAHAGYCDIRLCDVSYPWIWPCD
jgi:hypothetical protein